jgi:hypothetical protein
MMLKTGTKVLSKLLNEECTFKSVRVEEHTNEVFYTFHRKSDDGNIFSTVAEDDLEDKFFFLAEVHPSVLEEDRKKTKKKRTKVPQPSDVEELNEPTSCDMLVN